MNNIKAICHGTDGFTVKSDITFHALNKLFHVTARVIFLENHVILLHFGVQIRKSNYTQNIRKPPEYRYFYEFKRFAFCQSMTKKMTHDNSLFFALCENVIELHPIKCFLRLIHYNTLLVFCQENNELFCKDAKISIFHFILLYSFFVTIEST